MHDNIIMTLFHRSMLMYGACMHRGTSHNGLLTASNYPKKIWSAANDCMLCCPPAAT